MTYGIKTPNFSSDQPNMLFIIQNEVNSSKTVPDLNTGLIRRRMHIIHDTRNIGKVYDITDTPLYICEDNINTYTATTYYNSASYSDIYNSYYRDFIIDERIKYGVEVKNIPRERQFSSRNKFVRIIDQVYFKSMFSTGMVECNFRFNHVRKIGVALPAIIFGDTTSGYVDHFWQTFSVFDNVLQVKIKNRNLVNETVINRPYEVQDRQISNNETWFGSPALIFDLSSL